jgi:hypothetical protein
MHYILRNGKVPDLGYGFADENEEPLATEAPQQEREERMANKVQAMKAKDGEKTGANAPKLDVNDVISISQHIELIRHDPIDDDKAEAAIESEIRKDANQIPVDLSEDIYCLGFMIFLKGGTNSKVLDRVVLKCVFTFVFQVMIVGLLMMEYLNVDASADSFKIGGFFAGITAGTPTMNLTRIICCFLLHVTILKEMSVA